MRFGSVLMLRCEYQHIRQTCMYDFFTIVPLPSDSDRDGVWASHRHNLPPARCEFQSIVLLRDQSGTKR